MKYNKRQYRLILEWLYLNDQAFDSKEEWREALLGYLKNIL